MDVATPVSSEPMAKVTTTCIPAVIMNFSHPVNKKAVGVHMPQGIITGASTMPKAIISCARMIIPAPMAPQSISATMAMIRTR